MLSVIGLLLYPEYNLSELDGITTSHDWRDFHSCLTIARVNNPLLDVVCYPPHSILAGMPHFTRYMDMIDYFLVRDCIHLEKKPFEYFWEGQSSKCNKGYLTNPRKIEEFALNDFRRKIFVWKCSFCASEFKRYDVYTARSSNSYPWLEKSPSILACIISRINDSTFVKKSRIAPLVGFIFLMKDNSISSLRFSSLPLYTRNHCDLVIKRSLVSMNSCNLCLIIDEKESSFGRLLVENLTSWSYNCHWDNCYIICSINDLHVPLILS